ARLVKREDVKREKCPHVSRLDVSRALLAWWSIPPSQGTCTPVALPPAQHYTPASYESRAAARSENQCPGPRVGRVSLLLADLREPGAAGRPDLPDRLHARPLLEREEGPSGGGTEQLDGADPAGLARARPDSDGVHEPALGQARRRAQAARAGRRCVDRHRAEHGQGLEAARLRVASPRGTGLEAGQSPGPSGRGYSAGTGSWEQRHAFERFAKRV